MTKLIPFIMLIVLVTAGLPAVDLPVECGDCGSCGRSDHTSEHISGLPLDRMYIKPISLTVATSDHCSLCRTPEQLLRDESLGTSGPGKISFSAIATGYSGLDWIVVTKHDSRFFRESVDHTSWHNFYLRC